MTDEERMAGLVKAYALAIRDAAQGPSGWVTPNQAVAARAAGGRIGATYDALLAAIGELERARDAQADRLAAFESCDRARQAAEEEVAALKAEVADKDTAMVVAQTAADRRGAKVTALDAEVARLAGVAREACDVAKQASYYAHSDIGADYRTSIADLRASIPTPDPAAVPEVARLRLALRDAVMLIRTVRRQSPDDTFGSTKHTAPWIPGTAYLANAAAMLLDRIEPIAEGATPDPAAFVAAVDEFGDACYELGDADHDDTRLASIRDRRYTAKAAVLALGGVR